MERWCVLVWLSQSPFFRLTGLVKLDARIKQGVIMYKALFASLLAGCVVGERKPDGADWNPLQGQGSTGVSTNPEDAGASSGSSGSSGGSGGSSGGGSGGGGATTPSGSGGETAAEVALPMTEDAYTVMATYGINDTEVVLECDADTDLLVRTGVLKSGAIRYSINGQQYDGSMVGPISLGFNGDALLMEAHSEAMFGTSVREYYTSVGYSNVSEVSPATWVGLCQPLGE